MGRTDVVYTFNEESGFASTMKTVVTVESCFVDFHGCDHTTFASTGITGFQLLQSRTPEGVMSVEISARVLTAHGFLTSPNKPGDHRPFVMIGSKGHGG
jgi:hypothetical protein